MSVGWEKLPSSGDGSVLSLQMPRPQKKAKKGGRSSLHDARVLPAIEDGAVGPNSPLASKAAGSDSSSGSGSGGTKYAPRGGFVTWTLLPFTEMSDQQYGSLNALASASLDSARRRLWFVLVDRVLYVYTYNSSKPKHVFPMLACSVTYVEGQEGLFKLRSPSEGLFLVDDSEKSGRLWFRKLYEQSPVAGKKTYEQLATAMQTPWAAADAEAEKRAAQERTEVLAGTTSSSKKNSLLSQLQKAGTQRFEDNTKGVIK